MNKKDDKNLKRGGPKGQLLLSVVTTHGYRVSLYEVRGFYVEVIMNEGKGAGLNPPPFLPATRVKSPGACRNAKISMDVMDLQRFSINLN